MGDRRHSRSGAASGHGARSGAGQVGGDVPPLGSESSPAGTPEDGETAEQAFARSGQFTGRTIPEQPHDPSAAADAFRRAAAAAPQPSADEIAGAMGEVPTTHGAPGEMSPLDPLARERDQFKADLQRLAADFDNFRKRAQREREQAAAAADERLLGELLAVLDDFERALEHAGAAEGTAQGQLADGIRMTHSRLLGVLEKHGLSEIVAAGAQFDPHLHEAMMMQPAPGKADGLVLQVVQKGYRLGDRVLRHAKVIVAGEG